MIIIKKGFRSKQIAIIPKGGYLIKIKLYKTFIKKLSFLSPSMEREVDHLIIGGGFFGSYLATILRKKKPKAKIMIIEKESDLMQRASYNNQARIHQGYHYPRHLLTAMRSHVNFPRFCNEFKQAVYKDFDKYYAIGKIFSKITANQFKLYYERIGSPLDAAPGHIRSFFNDRLIEDVFKVKEYAFDAVKLKKIMKQRLKKDKIIISYDSEVAYFNYYPSKSYNFETTVLNKKSKEIIQSKSIFLCNYSNINTVLKASKIPLIELKQEMTEMAIVSVPPLIKKLGITVMCGPFFSCMPFPPTPFHTLSHVRYTPHHYWYDSKSSVNNQKYYEQAKIRLKSNFNKMIKDAIRYMPALEGTEYKYSIWEIKTVLPASENDDGRPILFRKNHADIKNLFCIMGGKLDNIYDLEDELEGVI